MKCSGGAHRTQPWEKAFDTLLKVHGLGAEGAYSLEFNDELPLDLTATEFLSLPIQVHPDGRVSATVGLATKRDGRPP